MESIEFRSVDALVSGGFSPGALLRGDVSVTGPSYRRLSYREGAAAWGKDKKDGGCTPKRERFAGERHELGRAQEP